MNFVHYTLLGKPVIIQNRWYNKVYSCDSKIADGGPYIDFMLNEILRALKVH